MIHPSKNSNLNPSQEDIALLRTHFSYDVSFTEEEWTLVLSKARKKIAVEGEFLINAGEVCDLVGIVKSGVFRACWLNETGKQRSLYFFFKHSPISLYTSFVEQIPTNAFLQCISDGEILYINWEDYAFLIKQIPNFGRYVRISTEQLTVRLINRVIDFAHLSAEERYIKLVAEQPDIFQRLPLSNIAEYINVEPQSLSRIRKRLSKSGNKNNIEQKL